MLAFVSGNDVCIA